MKRLSHFRLWSPVTIYAIFLVSSILLIPACRLSETTIDPFDMENGIAVGDLNRDGFPDIVVASRHVQADPPHKGYILAYLQDKNTPGTYATPVAYEVGPDPWGLALADINNDGWLDVAVVGEQMPDAYILFADSVMPGSFLPAVKYTCGASPQVIACADLNDDQLPDLAVAKGTGAVALLFQDKDNPGTFLPALLTGPQEGSLSVAIGDMNGDVLPDLAATGAEDVSLMFQLSDQAGIFDDLQQFAVGERPSCLVMADFDANNSNDIIVANAGSSFDGSNSTVSLLLNLKPAVNYPAPNGTRQLVVTDLNGDGRADVAVVSIVYQSTANAKVAVMLQDTENRGKLLP